MIIYNNEHKYFYSSLINDKNYIGGFNTVFSDDTSFLSESYKVTSAVQGHTTNIEVIENADKQIQLNNVDGLITTLPEHVLTVYTSDCVPVIFTDKVHGIVGISHQGWKGTYDGMVSKMLKTMISLGAGIKTTYVAVGPAIGGCCYEIYGERMELFRSKFGRFWDTIYIRSGNTHNLNLAHLNYLLAAEAGVPKENIDYFPFCTKCDDKRFHSFQREGKGKTGRMINFIGKTQ